MTSLSASLVLSAALACAFAAIPAYAQTPARAAEAPLEGAAYLFAQQAYKSFDAGQYALAQQQAESALVLRPDVERLHLLLIYALQKQGKIQQADKAAADAINSGLNTPALRQARANLRATPTPAPSRKATAAGKAPTLATPNKKDLAAEQATAKQQMTAEQAVPADKPGDAGGDSPAALAYAAYARQDYQEAIREARKAVTQDPENKEYQRLLTTALAAGDAAQMAEASTRLNEALAAQPDDPTLLMQRGYLRQRMHEPKLAVRDFEAARATGKAPPTAVLDEGYALAGAGDKRGAVERMKQAIDDADAGKLELTPGQRFDTRSNIANLSREWGGYFSAGYRGARPASSGLGGAAITVPGDAVFSTAEIFWRPSDFLNTATRTFEVYGRLSNTLYDKGGTTASQTVSDPCGNGAFNVSETDNDGIAGIPTTVGALGMRFTPSTAVGLTFGLERQFNLGTATRRGTFTPDPAALRCALNQDNQTAHYKTDTDSGGWQAYVTYGLYEGTMLRIDRPDWFTMEGYVQAGYAWHDNPAKFWLRDNATGQDSEQVSGRLKRDQAFGAGELRVGRSYRMDAISERLVFFPYAVIGADWLWTKNQVTGLPVEGANSFRLLGDGASWSMGAGPGFNLRYWFREDHYNAPRSYLDLTTQYRFNIGGGSADRAKGLFINLTLSY